MTFRISSRRCAFLFFALVSCLASQTATRAADDWHLGTAPLMTRWATDVSPQNTLQEYPRPQLARTRWHNLNGLWDYAIRPKDEAKPDKFDGKILVPFAIESALSGVMGTVGETNRLWYRRSFQWPADWNGQR